MRFGFNRAIAFLSSLIGMSRDQSGAAQTTRSRLKTEPHSIFNTEKPKAKHRHKTGGPNWLKIAINSQKHR